VRSCFHLINRAAEISVWRGITGHLDAAAVSDSRWPLFKPPRSPPGERRDDCPHMNVKSDHMNVIADHMNVKSDQVSGKPEPVNGKRERVHAEPRRPRGFFLRPSAAPRDRLL
jgi:hypothetical protein